MNINIHRFRQSRESRENRRYLITFTDLVYAALLSYSLPLLHSAVEQMSLASVIIVFAVILLVYDWYGEHFIAVQGKVGIGATVFDFAALLVYFGLLFFSASASFYVFLFLAARALRGIMYDIILMTKQPTPLERTRLKSWTISSSLMLVIYLGIFFSVLFGLQLSDLTLLVTVVSPWAFSYLLAYIVEKLVYRKENI